MKYKKFKLNAHFYDFINDWTCKTYFLVGGYGSSKSYHIAVKLITKLLLEKRKALVVREVYDTIRDSCYDLLLEVAEAMEVSPYLVFTVRSNYGDRDCVAYIKWKNGLGKREQDYGNANKGRFFFVFL